MAAKISKGTKFRGVYMGGAFTGTVTLTEADASGYPGTQDWQRAYIELDADLVRPSVYGDPTSAPWTSHKKGDRIVMNLRSVGNGLCERTDDKYENVFIVR